MIKSVIDKIKSLPSGQLVECFLMALIPDFILSALFWILGLIFDGFKGNITYYCFHCLLFIVTFIFAVYRTKPAEPKVEKNDFKTLAFKFSAIAALFYVINLLWTWNRISNWQIINDTFGVLIAIAVIVLMSVLSACYLKNKSLKEHTDVKSKIWNIVFWTIAILITAFVVYRTWGPDTTSGYNVHHKSAYLFEYFARAAGVPYSELTNSVYGHFGIIAASCIKLFSDVNLYSINVFVCILAGLNVLLVAGSTKLLLKDRFAQIIVLAGLLFPLVCHSNYYWQAEPHRSFLIALVVFVLAVFYKKRLPAAFKITIQIILCAFALLWMPDMGVATLLTFFLYNIIDYAYKKGYTFKGFLCSVIYAAIYGVSSFVVSLLSVNIYNLLNKGSFVSPLAFFWPILGSSYAGDITNTMFGKYPTFLFHVFWIPVMFLCIAVVAIKKSDNGNNIPVVGMCIFALGSLAYFESRPILSYFVTYTIFIATLLLLWAAERVGTKYKFVAFTIALCLSALCMTMLSMRYSTTEKYEGSYIDAGEYVAENIPEGTMLFGEAAWEIGSLTGYPNDYVDGVHITTVENGYEEEKKRINEYDSWAMCTSTREWSISDIPDWIYDGYKKISSYQNDGIVIDYYERIKP